MLLLTIRGHNQELILLGQCKRFLGIFFKADFHLGEILARSEFLFKFERILIRFGGELHTQIFFSPSGNPPLTIKNFSLLIIVKLYRAKAKY